MLENGEWALGTNFEMASDEIMICGERSAIPRVLNKFFEKLSLKRLEEEPEYLEKARNGLKVKYLAASSFKELGTDKSAADCCSDCLSWLNTEKCASDDTTIAYLLKNPETQKMELHLREIKESLPYGHENVSLTNENILELPLISTQKAKNQMCEENIGDKKLIEMLEDAKKAYETNTNANVSKCEYSDKSKNTTATVLFSDGKTVTAQRVDWTRRWFTDPALIAASIGLQNTGNNKPEIVAIAYYGNTDVPNIQAMGRISQSRGNGDTLIVTAKDDTVNVRTILDYMPNLYVSSKKSVKS
ncbi:hypothetical protein EOM81_13235 [bacterium]|nr:hypothetical protein [bacterium]